MTQPAPPLPPVPPLDARGLPVGYAFKADWEVTPRDVERMRREGKPFTLLDCRRPEEWHAVRLDGATWIQMSEIEKRAEELEDDEGGRGGPVVVYCHHGVRSLKVTAHLRGLGFGDVKSMAGGIDLWAMDVDPGIRRY